MLAPTFDILEDTDVYSESTAAANSGGLRRSKSVAKKGLGLRASSGPNRSNVQALGGPQKLGGGNASSAAASSSKFRRASARKQDGGVSSSANKVRAFGAVLATPNSNNASMKRGQQHKTAARGKGGGAAKAGPTPMRVSRPVLGPREKNVTAIEVCHKGSGSYMPFDAETAELMQTNKNAERLYRSVYAAAMVGVPKARGASSCTAPLDDEAAFGIFEDDGGDAPTAADGGKPSLGGGGGGLMELEGANLW